jgi:hypothetical protein
VIVTYYLPPIHTERTESSPWDGCWAHALAMGIDAATSGALIFNEAQIRRAASNPDRPGVADGGNIEDQLDALRELAPKVRIKAYPTEDELRDHLAAGRGAILSGWQSNAPIGQRKYDARFYDRAGNGHGIYVQGVGDKVKVHWYDPLIPAGAKPPVYRIADALRFVWNRGNGTVIAILVWPTVLNQLPKPPADRVKVVAGASWWDYDISGTKAKGYEIGREGRVTRGGFTAELAPSRIEITWADRKRRFAKVVSGAYMGSWVDLLESDRIKFLPAA